MSLSDELAAKDALIKELTAEKHAQAEQIKKVYDNIFRHLVLDLEDIIHEAGRKVEEPASDATDLASKLATEKHAKVELAKKLYDKIFRYLVLDLKDMIHEAGEKTETDTANTAPESERTRVSISLSLPEPASPVPNHQSTHKKR